MSSNKFDILVVGGGMVGAAAALGFARQGRKVAVLILARRTLLSPVSLWMCVSLRFRKPR